MLDATLRLARAEDATLVPAYLARVPMHLPLAAPLPRQCVEAMPLLEAIERRATHEGVAVDARIERGRTYRHALRELLASEHQDRIVIAADTSGTDGFDAADVAWLLQHAPGEILVLRPAHDRLIRAPAPEEMGILAGAGGSQHGMMSAMFFFFSNNLGCFGSILVSLAGTLVLLLVLGVVRL